MKHGSVIFVNTKFDIKDVSTWMSPFIKGAMVAQDEVEGFPEIVINHVAGAVEHEDGLMWIYEAGWNKQKRKAEVIRTPLDKWLEGRDPKRYIVKHPTFEFDPDIYRESAIAMLGRSYGFARVLVFQPIRLLTFKRMWLGSNNDKHPYCSMLYARLMNLATSGEVFETWPQKDPADLFNSELFETIYKN